MMNEQKFREAFAARLRKGLCYNQRNRRAMTQHELAQVTGLHYSLISKFARAKRTPNALHLRLIADALNVSIDWLCALREHEGEKTI